MMAVLKPHEERIYAVLRMIVGFMFLCHGLQKVFGIFGGAAGEMDAGLRWTAGLIELVGGSLVALGLLTRLAALISSGMMAVAYFKVHQPLATLPIENQGELAVLYCWIFLLIAARGSGIWSVDSGRGGARSR